MLLFLLFLNCFLANIATEDIKATLAPLYKQFEDWCVNGRVESAVNLYHNITRKYNVMWQTLGPHTFKIYDNGTYQGTDDYKIAEFEFDLMRKEGREDGKTGKILTGKFTHIWKKDNGQWRIYHEQYQRINRTAQ
nr:Protein C04E6.8 [Haemonchus contortus]